MNKISYRLLLGVFIVLLAFSPLLSPGSGAADLQNTGFEDWTSGSPDYWDEDYTTPARSKFQTTGDWVSDDTEERTGTYCAKVTLDTGPATKQVTYEELTQVVSASRDDALTFAFYAKTGSVPILDLRKRQLTGNAYAVLVYYDSSDGYLGEDWSSSPVTLTSTYPLDPISVVKSGPIDDLAKVYCVIHVYVSIPSKSARQPTTMDFYVDDASLTGDVAEFPAPILVVAATGFVALAVVLLLKKKR